MAGAWATIAVKDGGGTSRNIRVWDESGAGTGPFSPGPVDADGSGSGAIPAIKAASTPPVAADPALVVTVSPNSYDVGIGTGGVRTPRVSLDTSQMAAIKAPSTAPVAADPALVVAISPNSAITVSGQAAIAPVVSAALESNHVMKAAAGSLFDWHATIDQVTAGGFIMVFDATSAPGDGAVTPKMCIAIGPGETVVNQSGPPTSFATGITFVFSTTGPFTKTASAHAFFSAKVQ